MQYNVQFSTEFGGEDVEYATEDEFLCDQFFSFQKYVRSKEFNTFNIFSLKEFMYDENESGEEQEEDFIDIDTHN